jgi:hypothetical protein
LHDALALPWKWGFDKVIGSPPLQRPRHPSGRLRIVFASRSFSPANPANGADAGKPAAFFLAAFLLSPFIITELDRCTAPDWFLVGFAIHNMSPPFGSVAGIYLA